MEEEEEEEHYYQIDFLPIPEDDVFYLIRIHKMLCVLIIKQTCGKWQRGFVG